MYIPQLYMAMVDITNSLDRLDILVPTLNLYYYWDNRGEYDVDN